MLLIIEEELEFVKWSCDQDLWAIIKSCSLEVSQTSDGLRLKHERQDEYQKRQRRKNFTHVEFNVIH